MTELKENRLKINNQSNFFIYFTMITLILMGLAYYLSILWRTIHISSFSSIQGVFYILDLVLTIPLFATCLIFTALLIIFKNRRLKTIIPLAFFFYGMDYILNGLAFLPTEIGNSLLSTLFMLSFIFSGVLLVICAFKLYSYLTESSDLIKLANWTILCALIFAFTISLDNYLHWLPDLLNPTLPRIDNTIQFTISFLFIVISIVFAIKCRRPRYNQFWTYVFLLIGLFTLSMHAPRILEALLRDYDTLRFISRFIWGIAGLLASILFLTLAHKSFKNKIEYPSLK